MSLTKALLYFCVQDVLIETLRRARPRFVVCLVPKESAEQEELDVALLRAQLRGSLVLPAARLHKQGFPDHLPLAEFRRQFGLLGLNERPTSPMGNDGEKEAVQETLAAIDWLEESHWRIGLTKVSTLTFYICVPTLFIYDG